MKTISVRKWENKWHSYLNEIQIEHPELNGLTCAHGRGINAYLTKI